jgi:dolichyl-phosphate-mannose--protein O-mannosyl transferase
MKKLSIKLSAYLIITILATIASIILFFKVGDSGPFDSDKNAVYRYLFLWILSISLGIVISVRIIRLAAGMRSIIGNICWSAYGGITILFHLLSLFILLSFGGGGR